MACETLTTLLAVFGVFIPALILPGPDFIGVVRSSMTRGSVGGLWTTLGVSLGLGFYATLSLLGLSAVLTEYQFLKLGGSPVRRAVSRLVGYPADPYPGDARIIADARNPIAP